VIRDSFRYSRRNYSIFWLPVLVFAFICVVELSLILILNDGLLVYNLDDTYIHLELARNIAGGHYGINPGEFSAPSSSILWPFLLAPFAFVGWEHTLPLFINFLSLSAVLILTSQYSYKYLAGLDGHKRKHAAWVIVLFLIFAMNIVGLVFVGMEHGLQVLFAVIIWIGLLHERETDQISPWLAAAIIFGPLVRFENLALSLPALIYLVVRRRYKHAIALGAILGAILIWFGLFLQGMDLGWLPTSVVVKSAIAPEGGTVMGLFRNLWNNLYQRQAVLLAVCVFPLIGYVLFKNEYRDKLLALWVINAALLHLVVGRFGGFSRYEIYIWAVVLLALFYLYRDWVVKLIDNNPIYKIALALGIFLLLVSPTYLSPLLRTPLGSNNIYEQQYQMHRFVVEYYNAPVAVNDIGWVSYRNDHYVLDLVGLASQESLDMQKFAVGGNWIDELAGRHGVGLAMIGGGISEKFDNWTPVGKLVLGKPRVTPANNEVIFYVFDEIEIKQVKSLLEAFQLTLPEGVYFIFW